MSALRALALACLLAGCVETAGTTPQTPRVAQVDVCRHPWAFVVDEAARVAEGGDVRLDLLVIARGEPMDAATATYALTWGRDPSDARAATGPLADLLRRGEWTLVDADGDGALGGRDRIEGRVAGADVAHAHWDLLLFDAAGAFVGGTPRCM